MAICGTRYLMEFRRTVSELVFGMIFSEKMMFVPVVGDFVL